MLYDENKDLPILEAGREERYTVKEPVKLLVEEQDKIQDKICSNTPLRVRTNLSFLVDISTLRCWRNPNPCRTGPGIFRISEYYCFSDAKARETLGFCLLKAFG